MSRTLYIIDGYAQIFRAYYAIRGGMQSPTTGEPTHVVFGFTGMLLKLFTQLKPDLVIVASDAPGKTFRDELYHDYKANREAMPQDLSAQIPRVMELVESFGIPIASVEGLEADDVIATITRQVLSNPEMDDVRIRIVSKDKDLEQLLCDRVTLYDIHKDEEVDVRRLWENKGVRPHQVIDLLAMTGDSVDNVPGVPGIGPKTAAKLIQEYGSIEDILANLDSIKGKRRENLEASKEVLALSRELVTLKDDASIDVPWESAHVSSIDLNRLLPLFKQLGFRRYQDEVRKLAEALGTPGDAIDAAGDGAAEDEVAAATAEAVESEPALPRGEYEVVTTAARLDEVARALKSAEIVSVDTETTGLEFDAELCGLSLSWEVGKGVYVPVRSPNPNHHLSQEEVLSVLGPILSDPTIPKCGHNLKFDARVLMRNGVRLRGIHFDTMVASVLIDPAQASHKLDQLALDHLGYRMIPIQDLIGTDDGEISMDAVPLDEIAPYAAEDADISLRLYHHLEAKVKAMGLDRLVRDVEAPLTAVLAEMENHGIVCDPDELQRQGDDLSTRVDALRTQVCEIAGEEFNVDSPSQLAEILFEKLGLPPGKRTKTGYSTDAEVLSKLAAQEDKSNPASLVPGLVLEYRQLGKLINTYLGNLRESVNPTTGRIHTTFHQLVTATGRLASHAPNLQNIPVRTDIGRQIRKAFRAPTGSVLICADYSQIELRILAHLSEDEGLVTAFEDDLDIHAAVAAQVFGVPVDAVTNEQRTHAKTINFGIIYGVTPYGLARRIDGLDVGSAARLIDDYKARFPKIDTFLQSCIQHALEYGYVVTMMGRRREIPEIQASNRVRRSLGERLAINSVVQGSAADLIKIAMVNVQRRIDTDALPMKLLLQIHDELIFEAPSADADACAQVVREEMEQALSLRVPLKAEAGFGEDWMSAK